MHQTAYRQFLTLEHDHWWFRGRRRIFSEVLARHLPTGRRLRILDAGCGVGGMLAELARYGDVVALDTSAETLRHCRQRGVRGAVAGDAGRLPFASQSFDAVALFDTLEHLPDDTLGLAEAHRVLRPGGLCLITVPAYQFLYADNDRVSQHHRRYTRARLVDGARRARLDVLHASYFNAVLLPLIIPIVLIMKLKERLRPASREGMKTNLSYVPPRWINRPLAAVLCAEAPLVARFALPFGHSLLVAARRPQS